MPDASHAESTAAGFPEGWEPRLTLLIAEDCEEVQEHLHDILHPEFRVVAVVADGREVLHITKELQPDLMTLDITLPSLNGFEIAKHLRGAGMPTKILFVSQHTQPAYVEEAKRVGGVAYVFKHRIRTDLLPAIRAASKGQFCYPD